MRAVFVFRSAALGDFTMAAPALHKLRQIYPEHKIVLLTIQTSDRRQQKLVAAYANGLDKAPWVEMVMPHLVDEVVVIETLRKWSHLLEIRRKLSVQSFDAAILMLDPCAPWFGRIKKLLLLRMLIGWVPIFGWRGKGSLKGDLPRLKKEGHLRHHVHGPLQFLSELSPPQFYRDEDLKFDLRPGPAAEAWAQHWIATQVKKEMRLIAIAPGALQPHKQWPLTSFQKLLSGLLARFADLHVVIVGTPNDAPLGQALIELAPDRISNLAGVTSIIQSAALLKHVRLLVGNDGGAMHLGDAMGCKVVSIVPGIEFPDSIEPWQNKELAVRWPVECAPCYSFTKCPFGHNKCMQLLPVANVFENCVSVL